MPEESFTVKDLGPTIAKILGLKDGDIVEIARNKLDANELKIIKLPRG